MSCPTKTERHKKICVSPIIQINRAMSSSKYVNTPERRRSKILPMLDRFSSRNHRTPNVGRISRPLRCPFTAPYDMTLPQKVGVRGHRPILCRLLPHRSTTCCCDHAQAHLEGTYYRSPHGHNATPDAVSGPSIPARHLRPMHESYHGFIPNPCANTSRSISEDLIVVSWDTCVNQRSTRISNYCIGKTSTFCFS
jgi:hypothetical protein